MSNVRPKYKEWTKEDLKFILNNWGKMEINEMVEELKLESRSQLNSIVYRLRRDGFNLERKKTNSRLKIIIAELKKEFNK